MNLRSSLAKRLSLRTILAVIAIFIAVDVPIVLSSIKSIKQEVIKETGLNLDRLRTEIESMLSSTRSAVNEAKWMIQDNLDDPDYMYRITKKTVENNPSFIGSSISFKPWYFEEKGEYFAAYSTRNTDNGSISTFQMGNENYNYFKMEWFRYPLLLERGVWTNPYFDEGGGNEAMVTYSDPIQDENGQIIGVVTADLALKDLTDKISGLQPYPDSYTFLLGREGIYISHPDSSLQFVKTIFDQAEDSGNTLLMDLGDKMTAGESGNMELTLNEKERAFVVYSPLGDGWSVGIVCPYASIFRQLNKSSRIMFLLCLTAFLLIYFIVRSIIRRNTQPITEFTYTAMNIAKGNFNAEIPEVNTKDELMRLRDSLSYMLKSINTYIEELKTTTSVKQRFESELNIASAIQSEMLPSAFGNSYGVDIHALLSPAKEVGGDLYDFIIKDDKLYFAIGDVSGKGVPAALFMAITTAAFRLVARSGDSMTDCVRKINNTFCSGNSRSMFVTMFVGCIDLKERTMEYCNAGHNPIVVISAEGEASFLHAKSNLAAGLIEDFPYTGEKLSLEKGSRILLYTDGVTEAERGDKAQFGEEQLLDFAAREPVESCCETFNRDLMAALKEFTLDNDQNDDITIMSFKL